MLGCKNIFDVGGHQVILSFLFSTIILKHIQITIGSLIEGSYFLASVIWSFWKTIIAAQSDPCLSEVCLIITSQSSTYILKLIPNIKRY